MHYEVILLGADSAVTEHRCHSLGEVRDWLKAHDHEGASAPIVQKVDRVDPADYGYEVER